jgi:glutaredoxin
MTAFKTFSNLLTTRATFKRRRFLSLGAASASLTVIAVCAFPPGPNAAAVGEVPPPISTTSGEAEIALVEHLASIGAKKYGAWWCPHCHAQQVLFGKEAFAKVPYVECDAEGQNAQTATCQTVGVASYPAWEINGQLYAGVQPLESLAQISGYDGPTNFKNQAE